MARSNDEKIILGEATQEQLEVFENEKKFDDGVKEEVRKVRHESLLKEDEAMSEESLRIKREGDKEIEKVNEELKEFIKKDEEEQKNKVIKPVEEKEKEIPIENLTKVQVIKIKIKKKIKKIKNKLNEKTLDEKIYIIKSILIILLTLLTVGLILATFIKNKKLEQGTYIRVELPKNSEYVSSILVNEEIDFFGRTVRLGRIAVDEDNTVFYFDSLIDFENDYRATLLDSRNRYYSMNNHFMRNLPSSNIGRVAAFSGIQDGLRMIKLEIVDNKTSEERTYYFEFDRLLLKQDTFRAYSTTRNEGERVKFENVVASETGTIVNYSLVWPEDGDYYYDVDNYGNGAATLSHDLTSIPLKTGELISYLFEEDDLLLLEGNYITLKSFDGILKIAMNNIYKVFEIYEVYNTKDILLKRADIEIELDDYTLVLEGMQKQENMAVLVYHLENNLYVEEIEVEEEVLSEDGEVIVEEVVEKPSIVGKKQINYEEPHNTETLLALLDAEIIITTGNMSGEVIKPEAMYAGTIGGELVFKDERLEGLTSKDFVVRVNKVKVNEADYFAEINLDYIAESDLDDEYVEEALKDIRESFEKRLAFKSGEITKSKLKGFDYSILVDKDFSKYYMPEDLVKKAFYGTTIVSLAVNDNKIHAIVNEDWRGETAEGFIYFNNEHKIIYDIEKKLIISDEIY